MNTLGSSSSCENYKIVNEYDERRTLYNLCKLYRRYAVQIKDCNSCIEDICEFHTKGFLCSNCHYDKCDQWGIPFAV